MDPYVDEPEFQQALTRWQEIAAPPDRPAPAPARLGPAPTRLSPDGGPTAKAAPAERPAVAGYEILGVLGQGGMGVVYKARQVRANRLVALKMLRYGEEANPEELVRFLTEVETAARLQHPHIVPIYEVAKAGRRPYFTMELVAGGSLADKIHGTPQPARRAVQLLEALARAVHFAHQHKIVHRDLKPDNVLLTADGTPKITDFGLAKRLELGTGLTQTGAVLGTPSYMAPEQVGGKPAAIGPATDVYALGTILYEMLTGRPPFVGETALDTLQQVQAADPVPPRCLQPRVPRDLETICLKCLEKEPRKRYGGAEELAGRLQLFLDGKPIPDRPVGKPERLWRWYRRNPALATLAGAVLLLLLLITGGSVTAAVLLDEARHEAEKSASEAQESKREAIRNETEAIMAQARAAPRSDLPGRRFDALRALDKAAEHEPASLRLRNLAIECLALPDLRAVGERPLPVSPLPHHELFSDMARDRYAVPDEAGTITVCRVTDGHTLQLKGPGQTAWVIKFSPDGRYLAAKYHEAGEENRNQLWVWDLEQTAEPLLRLPLPIVDEAFSFTPDSQRLAVNSQDGALALHDLSPPHRVRELARKVFHEYLAIDATGRRLAAVGTAEGEAPGVRIYDVESAQVLRQWQPPAGVRGLAWRPHGGQLALACEDHNAYLCKSDGTILGVCAGHDSAVIGVVFNHGGDLLATTSWDGSVRLWDAWTGRRHVTVNAPIGTRPQFSPDDRFLGFGAGDGKLWRWEVAAGRECRGLHGHFGAEGPEQVVFSPTAPLLASSGEDGVRLWDVNAGVNVRHIPLPETKSVVWQADGAGLITCSHEGLQRWPVTRAGERQPGVVQLGPPTRLAVLGAGLQDRAGSSPGGRWIAATDSARGEIILIDAAGAMQRVPVGGTTPNRWVTVSPDGRWLATSAWAEDGARVWDVRTAKLVANLPCANAPRLAFSPDGRWLVTGTGLKDDFWEVGTWKAVRSIPHEETGDLPRPVAFSSDGTLVAVAPTRRVIRLLDGATGRELATLRKVNTKLLGWLSFSSDGSQLAAATDKGQVIYLWDLRRIRQQLAQMNQDWDLPAYPPVKGAAPPQSVEVKVLPDELARR
jgi:WD40 repeat protein/tRNA A-37 threonylcarbamoyl transferase component Bud32